MMDNKDNLIPYRKFLIILTGLIALTLISVILTQIYPCDFTTVVVLLIAAVNSFMVLRFFMHLRFDNRLVNLLLVCIALLISLIIAVTLSGNLY